MNADMKWLDNPEVFRVNQLEAHSDHTYYESYEALEKKENALIQSLNGQWEFAFSKKPLWQILQASFLLLHLRLM